MRTIIIAVIILVVVTVLVIDGLGMFAAHRTAVEVARGAAQQATRVYVDTRGNEGAAKRAVQSIADEANVQLVEAGCHKATTRWYQVSVRVVPDTNFLGRLPYVRDMLTQESTAVVHF
jgi:hypothetical protein